MLKQAKELYVEILSVDDYVELFGKPNDNFGEQDQELLYRLIKQATTQFDSLVSTYGNVSSLYQWWNDLKDNDEDNSKGFRLQKAIGSWVETMVQNGKFWTDGVPNMSSNIDYSLNSSAKNSNIELKRKDIIQDLVACGLTKTTNFGSANDNNVSNSEYEGVLITSKQFLVDNYLGLDSKSLNQSVKSPIDMSENGLENCGDIWNSNPNKRTITNFRLRGCVINGEEDDNEIVGVSNALTSNKILDPNDMTYKFINQFPISYWNGLTQEQIYFAIKASGSLYNPTFNYGKDFVVMFKLNNVKKNKNGEYYGFAISLIDDNIGNDPNTSPQAWKILPSQPTDINSIIQYVKEYIDNTIVPQLNQQQQDFKNEVETTLIPNEVNKQLNELPTIDNIIYKSNQWIPFESKEWFDTNVKTPYQLQESVDYIVLDKTFIGHNEVVGVYGSNLLKQSDLPNGPLKTKTNNDVNSSSFRQDTINGVWTGEMLDNSSQKMVVFFESIYAGAYVLRQNIRNFNSDAIKLNYGEQTQFLQEHKSAYFVMFKKDIVKKSVVKVVGGKEYTFTSPLNEINGNVSIESSFVDKVNKVDTLEDDITNDILPNLEENTLKIQELEKQINDIDLSQVETNKNDIVNIKQEQTNQNNAIALNQQKIESIKSLDNLVAGDNIVTSPQGDSEVFINTSDNLTINSLTARDGTIEIESTAHFKQTPHIKQSLFIDNENLKKSSEIAMLDNDLKIVNGNGDILLADKTGVINTRTLKDNQDKIIEGLDGSLIWKKKGVWNAQTTYVRYDVVTHKNDSYWLDKDTSIGEEPSPKNSFWIDLTPQTTPTYSKEVIDNKFETTNTNVSNNTNEINDLKLKHQLNQQLINDIGINHKFTIDPLQSANWELGIVYSELDPTDPSKSTIKIVPSTLKEYQLKHSLTTFANDIALVKSELKDILTSTNKDTIKQLFYGQEDKDQDPRTYGYITSYGTIPLAKQVGVRTFGNIFNVDYNEWNGVFYNNVKIPFGTKNDSLGIDLTSNSFQATSNIQNIILYKEVVNDGITEAEVNEKLKSYATNDSVSVINDKVSANESEIINLKAKDTQIENNIKQTNIKIDGIVLDGTTRKNTIDNRTLLSFQLNISSHRESGYEWQSELPSEIQNTTFLYVESIEYSCLETGSEFGYKVFSPYIANISAYKKNNKLCLRNENNIPSYINYIRFRVLVG